MDAIYEDGKICFNPFRTKNLLLEAKKAKNLVDAWRVTVPLTIESDTPLCEPIFCISKPAKAKNVVDACVAST
jgi:hypothetical protein